MKRRILVTTLVILCGLLMTSCKETKQPESKRLTQARTAYVNTPNKNTGAGFITELHREALIGKLDQAGKNIKLDSALNLAKKHDIKPLEAQIIHSQLKINGSSDNIERVLELADILKSLKNTEAADVLYKGYTDKNGAKKDYALQQMSQQIENIDTFVQQIRMSSYEEGKRFGLNNKKARTYVDVCEAYAMAYDGTDNAATNLFNAAETAKSLRNFTKCFALYDWVREKYPNHPKAPTSLFLKGFVMENEIKNNDQAKIYYDQFLTEYPNHELADDVQFLKDNLGKSEKEILKLIEVDKTK